MDSTNMKYVSCSMLDFLNVQLIKHINERPFFPKLSSEPVAHQHSHVKKRSYWKQSVDFIYTVFVVFL